MIDYQFERTFELFVWLILEVVHEKGSTILVCLVDLCFGKVENVAISVGNIVSKFLDLKIIILVNFSWKVKEVLKLLLSLLTFLHRLSFEISKSICLRV